MEIDDEKWGEGAPDARCTPWEVTIPTREKIDWPNLEHAYGSAGEVPGLLAQLASPTKTKARKALKVLSQRLNHQGSVYSASAAAVPELLELVREPATLSRPEILHLVTAIVLGDPDDHLDGGLDLRDPAVARRYQDELSRPYLDAYRSVAARVDDIISLLDDGDPRLRAEAAFLLAFLAEPAARSLAAVRARDQGERSAPVRASLLLTQGLLCRYLGTEDLSELDQRVGGRPALLGAAASIARVWAAEERPSEAALAHLADVVESAPSTPAWLPWGDLGRLAERVLFRVRPPAPGPLLDEVERLAREAAPAGSPEWKRLHAQKLKLQRLLFSRESRENDPVVPGELDPDQRRFLALVHDHALGLTTPGFYGLPRWPAVMERLLGRHRGPLDAELPFDVDGQQRTWPIWRAFQAVLDGAWDLEPMMESLCAATSPRERLELAEDLMQGQRGGWGLRIFRESWGYLGEDAKRARVDELQRRVGALHTALHD